MRITNLHTLGRDAAAAHAVELVSRVLELNSSPVLVEAVFLCATVVAKWEDQVSSPWRFHRNRRRRGVIDLPLLFQDFPRGAAAEAVVSLHEEVEVRRPTTIRIARYLAQHWPASLDE